MQKRTEKSGCLPLSGRLPDFASSSNPGYLGRGYYELTGFLSVQPVLTLAYAMSLANISNFDLGILPPASRFHFRILNRITIE